MLRTPPHLRLYAHLSSHPWTAAHSVILQCIMHRTHAPLFQPSLQPPCTLFLLRVARGSGTAVAWHASQPIFAALEEAPPALGAAAAPPGKPSKDPKKAAAAAEAARLAAEAAARAAAATAAVRIKGLGGVGGASVVPHGLGGGGLDLGGELPAYVQGGPLLAVTLRRAVAPEGAELAGAEGCVGV